LHKKNTPGASRSEVSRLWQKEGKKYLEEFRSRDIASQDWLVLMMDGISLSDKVHVVVAMRVNVKGEKVMLDFEIGSSESTEVCAGVMKRLIARGFNSISGCRLLAVLDGAAALKKAVLKEFPDTIVQRCLVHSASRTGNLLAPI
jgi:transposase-like protein